MGKKRNKKKASKETSKTNESPQDNKKKSKKIRAIDVISFIVSGIALVVSFRSLYFARQTSPLIYSCPAAESVMGQVSSGKDTDVNYNLTSADIVIENYPGKIAEVYIASIWNDKVDIYNCERENQRITLINDLMLKYEREDGICNTKLSVGFAGESTGDFGYFFLIFKSYAGEYYYNVVHYIKDNTSTIESDGVLYTSVNTFFLKMQDVYNRNIMQMLCDEIKRQNYAEDQQFDVDSYTKQIENDYQIIKSKFE